MILLFVPLLAILVNSCKKLPRRSLIILKNGPLYGASQSAPKNVNPPLAQIHHQTSHINFSSPHLTYQPH